MPINIDLLTHGSPCQDFSVAGKGLGADGGTRSSLMWNSVEIINHSKPKVVVWENVKNVISKKHKHNFDKYIDKMEQMGYMNYYQVLNAKHYGIPQNRERIFVVSVLNGRDFKFPEPFDNGVKLRDLLLENVNEKYYLSEEQYQKIICSTFNQERGRLQKGEICSTLLARDFVSAKCVAVPIKEATKKGYAIAHIGDSIDLERINVNTRRGRVVKDAAHTITTSPQ